MRHVVAHNLAFGDLSICTYACSSDLAVVHACKDPCHRHAVGYSGRGLPNTHPNYLVLERDNHLYLNLIDPPGPLFMMESFVSFLAFVDKHVDEREVLIHCNLGESRAPSLALVYLAKRLNAIANDSFPSAARDFSAKYPYSPGKGIQTWLTKNWMAIR